MKAIVVRQFGDPSVLTPVEIPVPEPGENEVRVRLYAAGINPVETYIRSGNYAAGLPALPYIPGTDGAGVIDTVGPCAGPGAGAGVDGGGGAFRPGACVFVAGAISKRMTGTYAQYAVCDAAAVFGLPDSLSFEQGAGLGTPGFTACQALFRRARIEPGETVLIHGASGGVGSLAVQLAYRAGAVVFATAGSERGLEMLKGLGASQTFNHREKGYTERILAATGGRGVDAVVEMLANVNLEMDLAVIAERGRIAVVGNRGVLEFNPRLIMLKDASVLGVMLKNMRPQEKIANAHTLNAALNGGLKTVISAAYPLGEAAKAHEAVMQNAGSAGKIVLSIE